MFVERLLLATTLATTLARGPAGRKVTVEEDMAKSASQSLKRNAGGRGLEGSTVPPSERWAVKYIYATVHVDGNRTLHVQIQTVEFLTGQLLERITATATAAAAGLRASRAQRPFCGHGGR